MIDGCRRPRRFRRDRAVLQKFTPAQPNSRATSVSFIAACPIGTKTVRLFQSLRTGLAVLYSVVGVPPHSRSYQVNVGTRQITRRVQTLPTRTYHRVARRLGWRGWYRNWHVTGVAIFVGTLLYALLQFFVRTICAPGVRSHIQVLALLHTLCPLLRSRRHLGNQST